MVAIAPLDWMGLRDLAWGLALPGTVETDRPQGPCLTAHGQLWTWWDRQTDAPGFRILPVERLLLSWRALAPRSFVEMFPGEGPPVPSYSRF